MSFTEILTNGLISRGGATSSYVIGAIAVAAISYLIGSVNFSLILQKKEDDVIQPDKGRRIAAFCLDFLKSAICVFSGILLMPADGFAFVAALFCIVGHAYPVYFGFRGNNSVAVYFGTMVCLNPPAAAISAVAFALFLLISKYVSLSSIAMTLVFPIVNFYLRFSLFKVDTSDIYGLINYILCTSTPIFAAVIVCITHIANIKRLIAGTETRLGENNDGKN